MKTSGILPWPTRIFARWALLIFAGWGWVSGCRHDLSLVDDGGGRKPSDFPESKIDVFAQMDDGIALTPDEIQGRNTWNLWCAGNEQFWDRMAREGHGLIDLLKTIDSRRRTRRFQEMGLINQPGCRPATAPDQYGLWLDDTTGSEPAGIDPKVHGRPTGIMGFRLFDNPEFKAAAAARWDPVRYQTDVGYSSQPDLIRPYRVGVACAACHVAFNPCRPPTDAENPAWENLASGIGNQYLREGNVFVAPGRLTGFLKEMLNAQPPGTSDTSRIATDHLNNPSAINPLVALAARLAVAPNEIRSGPASHQPSGSSLHSAPLILKDGADSVGVSFAILRVYVNTGMYSQHWLQQHDILLGLTPQKPFSIATARQNSVYWKVTEQRADQVVNFLLRLQAPRLQDAPGGSTFISLNDPRLARGANVFAEACAECHSSKRPPPSVNPTLWFQAEVAKPDFRDNNSFSDGRRHSVTRIGSNAARALGTNARRGNIWNDFSSDTYKALPSPGTVTVPDPGGEPTNGITIPSGGPGYYLTPSLAGLWSTAPFLHNNSLGIYTNDPSVAGRMRAFEDAATQLLWPERRNVGASIWRSAVESSLEIPGTALPQAMKILLASDFDQDGWLRLGPIPAGTPINLIANIDMAMPPEVFVGVYRSLKSALAEMERRGRESPAATALFHDEVLPALLKINKCPDFVENRGHTFGEERSDIDKRALIEFLKTL